MKWCDCGDSLERAGTFMTGKVSIAFVDDHPMFVEGLRWFFAQIPDFNVIASGCCADDALKIAENFSPDVILMDLRMPGDPFVAMHEIMRSSPATKVITFTAMADVNCATRALESGACGYILKGATSEELAGAIRTVVAGENYITPAFATKVISALSAAIRQPPATPVKFNVREAQIITLLLTGATNKEIGERLKISEKTVRHYMTLLMRKLNVRNRLEVVMMARKCDLLSIEQIANGKAPVRLN
jgi:DNA-binding NarL/FixJ family response regulator